MNSYTNVYLDTIDPLSPYSRLISPDVLFSVVIHACFYLVIIIFTSKLFNFTLTKKLYFHITLTLHVIMVLGYIGRLARSKSIYYNLRKRGESKKEAQNNTIKLMHHGYFTYYFLG